MSMMANRTLKVVGLCRLLVRQRSPRIKEYIYFHTYLRKNKGSEILRIWFLQLKLYVLCVSLVRMLHVDILIFKFLNEIYFLVQGWKQGVAEKQRI